MKLYRYSTCLILFASVHLLVACGSSDDSSTATMLPLEGAWAFKCLEISSDKSTELQSHSLDFMVKAFKENISVYDANDKGCESAKETRAIKGIYTEGKPGGESITPIDFILTAVTMTVNDEATIAILNADTGSGNIEPICGGGWTQGKSKTLIEEDCKGNSLNLPYSGLKLFDIYQINEQSLSFGSKRATTEDKRPQTIDKAVQFARL